MKCLACVVQQMSFKWQVQWDKLFINTIHILGFTRKALQHVFFSHWLKVIQYYTTSM